MSMLVIYARISMQVLGSNSGLFVVFYVGYLNGGERHCFFFCLFILVYQESSFKRA
jgi:hypothetical protein